MKTEKLFQTVVWYSEGDYMVKVENLEGMQVMQILGNNMAYFINCKNVATKMGIEMPKAPDFVFTNFIR